MNYNDFIESEIVLIQNIQEELCCPDIDCIEGNIQDDENDGCSDDISVDKWFEVSLSKQKILDGNSDNLPGEMRMLKEPIVFSN